MEKIVVIGSNSFSGSDFIDHALNDTNYRIHGVSRSRKNPPCFFPTKGMQTLTGFHFTRWI